MQKSWLLGLALTAMTLVASAQVYEWRDAQGRRIFGDMPPPGVDARLIHGSRPAATRQEVAPAEQQEDTEGVFAAAERELAAQRARACAQAQAQIATLESDQRISRLDEQGERVFLSDEERAQELADTRRFIADNCP